MFPKLPPQKGFFWTQFFSPIECRENRHLMREFALFYALQQDIELIRDLFWNKGPYCKDTGGWFPLVCVFFLSSSHPLHFCHACYNLLKDLCLLKLMCCWYASCLLAALAQPLLSTQTYCTICFSYFFLIFFFFTPSKKRPSRVLPIGLRWLLHGV